MEENTMKIRLFNYLFITILSFSWSQIQPMQTDKKENVLSNKEILYALINNPQEALDYLNAMKKELNKEIDEEKSFESGMKIRQDSGTKCSIIMLDECDCEKCPLMRKNNPKYRGDFESLVVRALIQKLDASSEGRSINYTTYAPGKLLQDLIIIVKTLFERPSAHIDIHIIDIVYKNMLLARDIMNRSHEVDGSLTTMTSEDIEMLSSKIQMCCNNKNCLWKQLTRDEQEKQQYVAFLQEMFPKAQIRLFAHASRFDYLQYLQEHQLSSADILTAVDIDDEEGHVAYKHLCLTTLFKKPTSMNFYLPQKLAPIVQIRQVLSYEKNGQKKYIDEL